MAEIDKYYQHSFSSKFKIVSLIDILSIIDGSKEVDEKYVLQSMLNLLTGHFSEIFSLSGSHITPIENLRFKDLSHSCTLSFLSKIARFGEKVLLLLNTLSYENEDVLNFTYFSFLMSLRDVIISAIFKPILKKFEVCSHESIDNLLNYLKRSNSGFVLEKINILFEITCKITPPVRQTASNLLNILHSYMNLDDILESWIITHIFLCSIRPSFNYIEILLTNGENFDPHDEFFFKLNTNLNPDNFWDNCITINEDRVPRFFQPCLTKIIIGIKSRLIIKMLDKHKQFKEQTFPKYSIFESFFNKLKKFLSPKDSLALQKFVKLDNLRLRLEKPNDFFIQNYNFLTIEEYLKGSLENYDFDHIPEYKCDYFIPLSKNLVSGMPIELALQRSFEKAIDEFIEPADLWLMNYVRTKYTKHLLIFNNYFLLQKSNVHLSHYLDALFTDITDDYNITQRIMIWQNYLFPEDGVKAFISYIKEEDLTSQAVLDNLHLIYENTDKISKTIINVDSKAIYDQAFQTLTQIMYARWILQNLKFPSLSGKRHSQSFHLLFIARYKLLFITNNLYNFMMNNIQENVEKLYESNVNAADYQKLRKGFANFINKIKLITLQMSNENVRIVRRLMRSIVRISRELEKIWQKNSLKEVQRFIEKSNIDYIEKALKIFYYKCFLDGESR